MRIPDLIDFGFISILVVVARFRRELLNQAPYPVEEAIPLAGCPRLRLREREPFPNCIERAEDSAHAAAVAASAVATSAVAAVAAAAAAAAAAATELELELIQTQMAQKPMLRAEVGMRVRCANKASAE